MSLWRCALAYRPGLGMQFRNYAWPSVLRAIQREAWKISNLMGSTRPGDRAAIDGPAPLLLIPDTAIDPFRQCWIVEIYRTLLGSLTDREREVIQLRYESGMTCEDTAVALGTTTHQSKYYSGKASKKLSQMIASLGLTPADI